MGGPACSVVVCTRHRAGVLARCLNSLVHLDHPSYEIIVVDNSEGDMETRGVAAHAGARYLVEARTGASRARNAGARAATGDVIAYIDDDAMADPMWLSHHANALRDPAVAGTTGPIVLAPSDTPAAVALSAVWPRELGSEPFRVNLETSAWFEMSNFGGVGHASNMALRRHLFGSGWGFRESIGPGTPMAPGGEENYAFFSLIRAGYTIAYLPDAVVHHPPPASMEELSQRKRRNLRNAASYVVMLIVEEPEFRGATLRYALGGFRGTRRGWRPPVSGRFATRGQIVAAGLIGPFRYLRARLRYSNATPVPAPPPAPPPGL